MRATYEACINVIVAESVTQAHTKNPSNQHPNFYDMYIIKLL